MKLRFSAEAKADLVRLGDYIAQDSPMRAVRFIQDIRLKCRYLTEAPFAFPIVSRFAHLGFRKRVVGNYIVLYRVQGDCIDVIHVVHGAQDYETWLEPRPDSFDKTQNR